MKWFYTALFGYLINNSTSSARQVLQVFINGPSTSLPFPSLLQFFCELYRVREQKFASTSVQLTLDVDVSTVSKVVEYGGTGGYCTRMGRILVGLELVIIVERAPEEGAKKRHGYRYSYKFSNGQLMRCPLYATFCLPCPLLTSIPPSLRRTYLGTEVPRAWQSLLESISTSVFHN